MLDGPDSPPQGLLIALGNLHSESTSLLGRALLIPVSDYFERSETIIDQLKLNLINHSAGHSFCLGFRLGRLSSEDPFLVCLFRSLLLCLTVSSALMMMRLLLRFRHPFKPSSMMLSQPLGQVNKPLKNGHKPSGFTCVPPQPLPVFRNHQVALLANNLLKY